jgi:hypothetical protein
MFDVFRASDPVLLNSPSPLRPEVWGRLLSSYPGDLPVLLVGILTHGATLGYEGPKQLLISRNLPIDPSDYIVKQQPTFWLASLCRLPPSTPVLSRH